MKILVTGSNGQLGRALAHALSGHEQVLRDLPELDIAEPEAVGTLLDAERPDWLVNAAAYTDVDGAETDLAGAERANVTGPRVLSEATAARGIPILHVSTDYVFDGETDRPYVETDAPAPRTAYGRTKLAGEEAVRETNPKHFVVRTAWLYSTSGRNFALTMLAAAARGSVRVVDDQTGSPTYAPHLAAGIARLLERRDWGTFHLANRGQTSWYGLTRALYRACGVSCELVPCTSEEFRRPAPRPRYSALATIREPAVLLPTWEEGVTAFAADRCAPKDADSTR
jgi:dTDP-4-dehydrorhamnose reductase